MDKKNLVKFAVIFAAAVFLGAAGFLIFSKKIGNQKKEAVKENIFLENKTVKKTEWEDFIPEIRDEIKKDFKDQQFEDKNSLSIYEKNDITGDGIPEALVSLGSGGAYTGELVLARFENEKPVLSLFKQKNGKVSYIIFIDGASASNGEIVKMLPDKNAIYSGRYGINSAGKLEICGVDAYRWNRDTKIFEYNKTLSGEIQADFCAGLKKESGSE